MKILFIGKESNPYSRHMIEHLANSNMAKFSVTVVNFATKISSEGVNLDKQAFNAS